MTIGTVISLCSGAMGFDLGFEYEGFEIKVSVEKAKCAVQTIKANRPDIEVIPRALEKVQTSTILEKAGLNVGEPTVIVGAPPCEPFSTAGRRGSLQDDRAKALYEFIRIVKEARPSYFAFEEVSAIVSAAERHIPFYDRILKKEQDLAEEEKLGSAFRKIMDEFLSTGYTLNYDPTNPKKSICNAADYGTPQKRKRFILIGSRDGEAVPLPNPTHTKVSVPDLLDGGLIPWRTLRDALVELDDSDPECMTFSTCWSHFLEYVPPGGCWKDLPPELQREALGGAYDDPANTRTKGKKGGRTGFLRRLSWDKPTPTLVDHPTTKAACLCHPDDLRPLSVKEYARIQGFPDYWLFCGDTSSKYRLIGQATPVQLSRAIAKAISHALMRNITGNKQEMTKEIILA